MERALKSVLITGASSGLGLETALYLAERDMRVYASMLDLAERSMLEKCARERGVSVRILELDITCPASIEAAVHTVTQETGGICGLVNNAGTRLRGCFEDLADDEVRTLFDTNVFGTMAVTRAVLPAMRAARRGRIVMMTSVAGRIGSFGVGAYCATKFAQEGFGESLALELAPFGIQVVLVEPGIVNTTAWNVHRVVGRGTDDSRSPYFTWFHRAEELADDFVRSSPIRPRDVAEAVHRALTARRPRLRYVVGRRAAAVIGLRRHLPGELFERFYFGQLMRRVLQGDPNGRARL
ncbi:MAG: SDR family NAD(P)-dependent oxidoreductase [Luteitalea sp.]|nr:SDR family NAD(P)-dependent oxidoreductase [Luteitalea sp.]